MKNRVLQKICCGAGFALVLSLPALAQQRGPGGPQGGGGHMPSMPSQMGGGATANTSTSATSSDTHHSAQASNVASQNAGAGVQFGPVGRWWDDKSVVAAVGLSSEQKRRMDAIFAQNRSAIVSNYQNLLKEQARLSALNKNPQADQSTTFAAIDAVNQARASLQKTVAQVYIQLRQQMSSDQIEKLTKLQ